MAATGSLTIMLCLFVVCSGEEGQRGNDIFGTEVCGTRPAYNPSRRIYGGEDASSGQYPWIGSMQLFSRHFCGCTLLNEEWAVTAAHCVVDSMHIINDITIIFGITNVKTLEPSDHRVTRSISGVVINPNSVSLEEVRNNDIAMLHLSSPIEFTSYVRPACVQIDPNEQKYRDCWVAGWGALGTATDYDPDDDEFPDDLQNVQMPLITQDECKRDEYRWSTILSDDMLCAGADSGLSTCKGDSGGPLVCRDQHNIWNLVGIVSWGRGVCRDTDPGVFCRVSRFVDFIQTSAMKYQECGREIHLGRSGVQNLTSPGYPGNYEEFTYCFWTIIAPKHQRIHASFHQFNLQKVDFLYIGVDPDSPKTLKYTGDVIPPDLVSPHERMYISFESDFGTTAPGFHLVFSSTTRKDFNVCTNGIEIIPSDKLCDGSPDCYDLSDEQCDTLYTPDVFNTSICGTRPGYHKWTRIHGGSSVSDTRAWPWIGSIQYLFGHECACTLLNDRWVVTTADCVINIGDQLDEVEVNFGQVDNSAWFASEHHITRKVAHSILNPEWEYILPDTTLKRNDLALLQLDRPVEFNDYVRPVCLTTNQDETNEYRTCKVAGWGETSTFEDSNSDNLREVSVPLVSPETCMKDQYQISSLVSNDMICAGGDSRGICPGDIGSPLVCEDSDGIFHLVGVASFGNACSDDITEPGAYSRISWQLPFLVFGVTTGRIPCRSDQFRCNDGQCLPSRWAQCNVTSECKDGSDEHNCDYCPEKEIRLSFNSTFRLQSVGYPYGYDNSPSCKWTVTPATNRNVLVQIIDFEVYFSTNLYVGNKANPKLISYSGDKIPKLRLLSKVDESLHFEFQIGFYDIGDSKGFSILLTDSNDQHLKYCPNGLEVHDELIDCQGRSHESTHHDDTIDDHHHTRDDQTDTGTSDWGTGTIGGVVGGVAFFVIGVLTLLIRLRRGARSIPRSRLHNVTI
ncbi:transmembrane protease serine 9-like [Amphiura filiformis]|uniref:transmembrane protease serine 9-like n=1 Tax=Amphiura filiformis TaxID=82378 RepID=UPI003B22238A